MTNKFIGALEMACQRIDITSKHEHLISYFKTQKQFIFPKNVVIYNFVIRSLLTGSIYVILLLCFRQMIVILKAIEACRARQPLLVVNARDNDQMSPKNATDLTS